MKKTIKKQIRVPFTLEVFEKDNPNFITRDGQNVTQLDYNSEIVCYPINFQIEGDDEWYSCDEDGFYVSKDEKSPEDLFELIEIEVEVEVDEVKRLEFNRNEFEHIVFFLQSVQDSFGDRKFFPEDSELKTSYNQQLQTWIDSAEALQKKIIYQHWTELPTPPDEHYGSLTDEYLQYLTNYLTNPNSTFNKP